VVQPRITPTRLPLRSSTLAKPTGCSLLKKTIGFSAKIGSPWSYFLSCSAFV
jgi:hypothetical protein